MMPILAFFKNTFNFSKLSYILPIFFAGKCFSWSKTPIYFFSCAGKFLNHTFSQKINIKCRKMRSRTASRKNMIFEWIFDEKMRCQNLKYRALPREYACLQKIHVLRKGSKKGREKDAKMTPKSTFGHSGIRFLRFWVTF